MSDLLERKKGEHGEFADNARIGHKLYGLLQEEGMASGAWQHTNDEMCMSLYLLCLKLARCVSHERGFFVGDCDGPRDVVGYARLFEKGARNAARADAPMSYGLHYEVRS